MTFPESLPEGEASSRPRGPLELDFDSLNPEEVSSEWLLERLLGYVGSIGLELYPAQEEAILAVCEGQNVVLNTPTGSGKSLVGAAACFASLARDERAFYTAPIKALVTEKFFDLCRLFGPKSVGLMTGDATVNRDAPVICCTAEILSNLALREGNRADVEWVVMDEFHYYADRDRGTAWQVPLLTLPQARFLLMSATLGDPAPFARTVTELTGRPTAIVVGHERPVPLDFRYVETPLQETVQDLVEENRAPIYIVHFSQRAAIEQAQDLTSLDLLSKEQKKELKAEIAHERFESPFGKVLSRYIPHGIGVHHAGLLPRYRRLIERLAQRGLLKVIVGTDTLGVGVNIPLRTVLFTQLCKYDGSKTKLLSVRDFLQIAGRAGRRGFDDRGTVVAQAPEHVIENLMLKRKAGGDPKKQRKLHLKKPPERGYVPWDQKTLEMLSTAPCEPLTSSFDVSVGMMLSVLGRPASGCRAMKDLLADNHDTEAKKRAHRRKALGLFRGLARSGVLEIQGGALKVASDFGAEFSLNQALSLYVLEVVDSLDRAEREYALLVVSLIESSVEDPGLVLFRQQDVLKGRRLAELKHAGVEYEERMAELEQVTHLMPPELDFLAGTFEAFSKEHPWAVSYSIAPKSVARDMYEQGLAFNGYVKEYGLERAEGVLLRYLSEVYRALERSLPDSAKTEELQDYIDWLGAEVRSVDASLLEEWTRLQNPEAALAQAEPGPPEEFDVTRDRRAFTVLVRNEVWRFLQRLGRRDYEAALQFLHTSPTGPTWDAAGLEAALASYFEEYDAMRLDPAARSPRYLTIEQELDRWRLTQIVVDPEEDLGTQLVFAVDLSACRAAGRVVLSLVSIERN
jgi:superfamily II RNA helicase